jgi:nucleoside-diphosphate-sugar epimerase
LVPKLLSLGHSVHVVDLQWFGNHLKPHASLRVTKEDIRNPFKVDGVDAVIHLAGVANDPTGDLDPKLTWEINALATMQLAARCVRAGVRQFIYASSGSVYGVSEEPEVTEDLPLVPLSEYNKTKMVAERVLLSYQDDMAIQIVRPATVCGYSPRMRLDVVVNSITMMAMEERHITIKGGSQYRPNIHIQDMAYLYIHMLNRPELTGIYNAGFENMQVSRIARMVGEKLNVDVTAEASNDPRSYRINSDKLLATGFKPLSNVSNAIDEVIGKIRSGVLKNSVIHHNLKAMQEAA